MLQLRNTDTVKQKLLPVVRKVEVRRNVTSATHAGIAGLSPGLELLVLPVLHCQHTADTYLGFKGSWPDKIELLQTGEVIKHLSRVQQTLTVPQTLSFPHQRMSLIEESEG